MIGLAQSFAHSKEIFAWSTHSLEHHIICSSHQNGPKKGFAIIAMDSFSRVSFLTFDRTNPQPGSTFCPVLVTWHCWPFPDQASLFSWRFGRLHSWVLPWVSDAIHQQLNDMEEGTKKHELLGFDWSKCLGPMLEGQPFFDWKRLAVWTTCRLLAVPLAEASWCAKVRSWHLPSCPSALRPAPSFGKRTCWEVAELVKWVAFVAM